MPDTREVYVVMQNYYDWDNSSNMPVSVHGSEDDARREADLLQKEQDNPYEYDFDYTRVSYYP